MKKFLLILGIVLMGFVGNVTAQLSAGDIAIVEFNCDGTKNFAFVALTDISSTESINFTDNGWKADNTWRTGEGIITWTSPTGGISCGTVVHINDVTGTLNTTIGTISESGSVDFSASGDQIIAYQGTSTMIAAINFDGSAIWQSDATSSTTSALPQGLTNGTNCIALTEKDNGKYNSTLLSGTRLVIRTAINTNANWTLDDTNNQTFSGTFTVTDCGVTPTLTVNPTSLSSFTYVAGSGPSINQSYNLSGTNLTGYPGNITVTAPTDYEVCLTSGGTYTSSVNVAYSSATLSATTIYVRLKTGLTAGSYPSHNITNTGGGASTVNVVCSGTVSASGSGCATDLFISEYVEGSSSNKYIEIYNGTGSSIDLSDYGIRLYANGASTPTNDNVLSGTLATESVVVYKNLAATIYGGTATAISSMNFNGDDAIALYKISTGSNVDIFGRIGEDPGTAWTSASNSTVDKTLIRKSSVTGGIATNPSSGFPTLESEWTQQNQDYITNLGSHTGCGGGSGSCVEPYPYMTGALINSCNGTCLEGNNEILFLNTGDYSISVTNSATAAANIKVYYDVFTPPTTNYTESFVSNLSYISTINTATIDCPTIFKDALTEGTIPANSIFFITRQDPCYPYDFSAFCGAGTIYVLFTSDANWIDGGNFANSASGMRYFRTNITTTSTATSDHLYSFNSDILTEHDDGDQVSWSSSCGAAYLYSNNGCTPSTAILPIELINFTATCEDDLIKLNWITTSEINNDYFTIECSDDGVIYNEIVKVKGAGNSNSPLTYQFTHYTSSNGYYRLSQTDFDGKSETFNPIFANCNDKEQLVNIYPNPTESILNIETKNIDCKIAEVNIYDAMGQSVIVKKIYDLSEKNVLDISILSRGTYYITFKCDDYFITKKILIN
jgi:hypothetical protein